MKTVLTKIPPCRKSSPETTKPNQACVNRVKQCFTNPNPDKFDLSKFGLFDQLICRETFLPAYQTEKEFAAVMARDFPALHVEKKWRCIYCGYWHATGCFPHGSNGKHFRTEKTLINALKNEE